MNSNIDLNPLDLEDPRAITGKYVPATWQLTDPPRQEFCVDPLLPIGAVTIINGHGGTGKSLLALHMAVQIALGLPVFNAPTNSGKVAYMSLEDPEVIFRERFYKIANSVPVPLKMILRSLELADKLIFIDRYGIPTAMAGIDSERKVVGSKHPDELVTLAKTEGVKCLIVDTLIRTHSLNENDNAQMGALLVLYERIAKQAECAVVLIHHQPKEAGNENYAGRGASAITDNARSVLFLKKVEAKEAENFNEEAIQLAAREERLVRVRHTKHNYSAGYPEQFFEITRDGVPLERFPTLSEDGGMEQRYAEILAWCQEKWAGKPITSTTVDEHYTEMRPAGTEYSRRTYQKALKWAVDEGYAEKIDPPEGASKNPNAKYYALSSVEQPEPAEPPSTPQ